MIDDDDAIHAARAILGGERINLSSDEIFARLKAGSRVSRQGLLDARRLFATMQLGRAVEESKNASDNATRKATLLGLARTLRPHLNDRSPGWLRFIVELGSERSHTPFRLDLVRRAHSRVSQPEHAMLRSTRSSKAIADMAIAGSILSRIEASSAQGSELPIIAAIERAINDDEIETDEGAALKAFHRFRRYCARLTNGRETYRLIRYSGSLQKFSGRWVALPDVGSGTSKLPTASGGRPKT